MHSHIAIAAACVALALLRRRRSRRDVADFVLKDLDGQEDRTGGSARQQQGAADRLLAGLNCKPCNELLPRLQDYYEQYREDGLGRGDHQPLTPR